MRSLDHRWQRPKDNWTLCARSALSQRKLTRVGKNRDENVYLQRWESCGDGKVGGGPAVVGAGQQGLRLPWSDILPCTHLQLLPFQLLLAQHQLCVLQLWGEGEGWEGEAAGSTTSGREEETSVSCWYQVVVLRCSFYIQPNVSLKPVKAADI